MDRISMIRKIKFDPKGTSVPALAIYTYITINLFDHYSHGIYPRFQVSVNRTIGLLVPMPNKFSPRLTQLCLTDLSWPCCKIGHCHRRVMIYINFVVLETLML